jgi:cephalosporin-C deacetylase-like acetyl esterase
VCCDRCDVLLFRSAFSSIYKVVKYAVQSLDSFKEKKVWLESSLQGAELSMGTAALTTKEPSTWFTEPVRFGSSLERR